MVDALHGLNSSTARGAEDFDGKEYFFNFTKPHVFTRFLDMALKTPTHFASPQFKGVYFQYPPTWPMPSSMALLVPKEGQAASRAGGVTAYPYEQDELDKVWKQGAPPLFNWWEYMVGSSTNCWVRLPWPAWLGDRANLEAKYATDGYEARRDAELAKLRAAGG